MLNQENIRKNDTQVYKKAKNGMYEKQNKKKSSKERQRMKEQ